MNPFIYHRAEVQSTLCGVLQPRTGQAGGKMLAAGLGAVAAWNEMPARCCCMT